MHDTVLVHLRHIWVCPVAVGSRGLDVEPGVVGAVPVGDAVPDEIQPGLEGQPFLAGESGFEAGMEEGTVGGELEGGALGFAQDGFGVGAGPVPELRDIVPLLPGAAVDEVRDGVEGCEAAGVEPGRYISALRREADDVCVCS